MTPPATISAVAGCSGPINVTLPDALLRVARELGVNLSDACKRGLAAEVASVRRQRWLNENQGAIDDWNQRVTQFGLPLAACRPF